MNSAAETSNSVSLTPAPKRFTGPTLIVVAAVMWSTSALFAKAPLFDQWPLEVRGPLLAFWRTLFGGLVLLPLVRRPSWTWRLVPSVLCFAGMNLTFLQTITRTSGANAIWLQYTAVFWVALIGILFFGEKSTRRDGLVLGLGMLGVAIIVVFETRAAAPVGNASGMIWGIGAGVTYAGVILSARALRDQDAVWLTAVNHLATAMLLLPFVLRGGVMPDGRQLAWVAVFGAFQMGIPYVFFTRGLKTVPAHQASIIALLEPLLVPVWVFVAWRHHASYHAPDWWTAIGGALILAGLILRFTNRRGASK